MFVFSFTRLLTASLVFGTEVWGKYAVLCGISASVFKSYACRFRPQTKPFMPMSTVLDPASALLQFCVQVVYHFYAFLVNSI